MKTIWKRWGLFALALCMFTMTGCSSRLFHPLKIHPSPEEEEEPIVIKDKYYGLDVYEPKNFVFSGRVLVVGDSTVCGTYSDARVQAQDLMGWGKYFNLYFTPEDEETEQREGVEVYNFAVSGSSSRSFLESSGYQLMAKHLSKGDYLIIQFGHNDERESDLSVYTAWDLAREDVSDTGADETGAYSFEWFLYEKYIRPAKDVGAVPILVSPTTRLNVESGKPNSFRHQEYREVMRKLAEEQNIPFVDLTGLSVDFYESTLETEGLFGVLRLHAFTDERREEVDSTHLSRYGAYRIAGLVARELSKQEIALANFYMDPVEGIAPRN